MIRNAQNMFGQVSHHRVSTASPTSWSTTSLSSTTSTSRCAQYGWTCVSPSRDANRGQRPRGLHHMLCSQVRTQLGLFLGRKLWKDYTEKGPTLWQNWHFSADVLHHLARGYNELKSESFSSNAHFDCLQSIMFWIHWYYCQKTERKSINAAPAAWVHHLARG